MFKAYCLFTKTEQSTSTGVRGTEIQFFQDGGQIKK